MPLTSHQLARLLLDQPDLPLLIDRGFVVEGITRTEAVVYSREQACYGYLDDDGSDPEFIRLAKAKLPKFDSIRVNVG